MKPPLRPIKEMSLNEKSVFRIVIQQRRQPRHHRSWQTISAFPTHDFLNMPPISNIHNLIPITPDLMITHDFLLPPFSCSWSATLLISETRTIASSLCFLRRSFHPSKFWTIIVSISLIDATVSASSKSLSAKSPLQSPQHHICYSFGNLIIHHQRSMTTPRIIKPSFVLYLHLHN